MMTCLLSLLMRFLRVCSSVLTVLFPFLSCSHSVPLISGELLPSPPKTYTEDAPRTLQFSTNSVLVRGKPQVHQFYFQAPSSYNADRSRSYPLVVYLHASGVDNRPESLAKNPVPVPGMIRELPGSSTHPAFLYVPVCPPPYFRSATGFLSSELSGPEGGEWNSDEAKAMVLTTMRDLQNRFHIDPNRVYFVGFSMGGSGSWYLASAYHSLTGRDVAGILRSAGWYLAAQASRPEKSVVLDSIYNDVSRVPTWLHIGGADKESVVVAEGTFSAFEKRYAAGPAIRSTRSTETSELVGGQNSVPPTVADFKVLPLVTGAELRLSIYRDRPHDELAFLDRDSLDWLFAQHR